MQKVLQELREANEVPEGLSEDEVSLQVRVYVRVGKIPITFLSFTI